MLLLGNALRLITHFWEYGSFAYLLPAAFLTALLLEIFLFCGRRRPWIPMAVCGVMLVACEVILYAAAALATGKLNLGIAFVMLFLMSFALAALAGFSAGLLIGCLTRKNV